MSTRREIEVVIVIQLGINHTSNAYVINYDQSKNCKDFNVPYNKGYNTQSHAYKSLTTPTVALFDDKGAIQSYGFEAELQHMQLDNASSNLLFREFIWDLFCSDETIPENLPAVNGRQMKSIDVLTAVLDYMIRHMKTKSGLQGLSLTLKYVLTLPTCACKDSTTFMKEAAVKAGCSSGNIEIVEEAAAVLQFCLHNKQDEGITLLDDRCNRKFLIVECKEDNATMSVLHFINEKKMEIVYKDNLEIWKGSHVLQDFVEMISFEARKTLVDFFEKYPLEYYEFLQEVKTKIRRISQKCSKINIKISPALFKETQLSESMQESVFRTGHKDELGFIADKCAIKSKRFQILLTEAGGRIVDYIEKQLFTKFSDINQIILVGEFAQSTILQDIIKTSFSAKNVIVPWEGNIAAVRGAVFFGQGHVSVVTDTIHNMQHTPLNNAQVALPKTLSKERGLRKSMIDDGKSGPSESKESSQRKLCVIL